jgi:hypothetical protein
MPTLTLKQSNRRAVEGMNEWIDRISLAQSCNAAASVNLRLQVSRVVDEIFVVLR